MTPADKLAAVVAWVKERLENCEKIAWLKNGVERDGWIEDANYFRAILAELQRSYSLDAESLAQQFHEAYERLAPQFGYETRKASAKPWAEVPEQNKKLMIAVCAELQRAQGRLTEEQTDKLALDIYQRIYWQMPTEDDRVDMDEIRSAVKLALPKKD